MPKKKPDSSPTQPSVPSPESSPLSFTIETFDDPETGLPTQYGRFSRDWQDEEALDVLIDKLEAGQLSHKQALMQARKLEATTPYKLEIQNFIANRLWALGLQDEATEVYERAYKQALAHIPKGFKGQITWGEVDNRPFLRLAHGTLLGLMRRRDKAKGGDAAMALAKQMLAWCPMDNIGVRFLLGDIALLQGDHKAAMKEYLNGAPNSPEFHPNAWYQAALIAFREGDYVAACTYLRKGIAANVYIAEGLTGRTALTEHSVLSTQSSALNPVHGPEWAADYLESAACDWTPEEIDFVDWVFNASPVLKERAEMMALHEGMTYEREPEKRAPYARQSSDFIDRITDSLSKKIVRNVKNRWGLEIWPWDRSSLR
jgi:hypothetical protein